MVLSTQSVRFLKLIITAGFILLASSYVRKALQLYHHQILYQHLAKVGKAAGQVEEFDNTPVVNVLDERDPDEESSPDDLALCPEIPPKLGPISANKLLQMDGSEDVLVELEPGGAYRPSNCRPRQRVAVIIPDILKDAKGLTMTSMYVIHNLLMNQQLDYRIFVVQPTNKSSLFLSRGLLMNIGFAVAELKRRDWECFVFHMPSIIPTDTRNLYRCANDHVRQLLSSITDFTYVYENNEIKPVNRKKKFGNTKKFSFGQVIAMTKEQFLSVNGFSNGFWPSDGEFGDMRLRLKYANHHFKRSPAAFTRYVRLNNTKFHIDEIPSFYYEREQMAVTVKPNPHLRDGLSTIPLHKQIQDVLYMYTSIEVDTHISAIPKTKFKANGKFLKLS